MDKNIKRLHGKTAIITGSSYGIGRGIAVLFGLEGANVVVNYSKSAEKAEAVVSEIREYGSKAVSIKADVSDSRKAKYLINTTLDSFGRIDILVNNAGAVE